MLDPSAPKQNANPTIHAVNKRRCRARRTPLEWGGFGDFQQKNVLSTYNDDSSADIEWVPMAPEDRAVFRALVDASAATNGKGVSILRSVGLVIPNSTKQTLKHPQFHVTQIVGTKHNASAVGEYTERVSRTSTNNENSNMKDQTKADPISSTTVQQLGRDVVDAEEVFDIIRNIQDPEHPHTLEQLRVVCLEHVEVKDEGMRLSDCESSAQSSVNVIFTPTVPHCSMATLIGLCIRVKLLRSLPPRFKVQVQIQPGTHASENAINKQLRDKERVCAALENKHLAGVVNKCIKGGMERGIFN